MSENLSQEELIKRALANPAEARKALDMVDCADSLITFIKQAWHTIEPGTPFTSGWAVDCMARHLEAVTDGQIKRLLINVPPGPIPAGQLVMTAAGRKPIEDLTTEDRVLTHKGRYRRVTELHDQGVLPTLEISTFSGRTIRCAPSHPLLTPRGWVKAQDIREGDFLAIVSPTEDHGSRDKVTAEEARFFGYLVGDGSVTQAMPTLTNQDWDTIEDFRHCAKSIGFETSISKYEGRTAWTVRVKGGKRVRDYLSKHELQGKSSYTKRIPPAVLESSREIIRNFIGAYWSCDGQITVRDSRKRGSIYRANCSTVSRGLAEDLLHAVSLIGIRGRLRLRSNKRATKAQPSGDYKYFMIEVQNEVDTARFATLPRLTERKRVLAEKCRQRFDQTLWEDEVSRITKHELASCYCITVDEDHSFTVSDLAVKNCTKSVLVNTFWPAWEWGPKGLPHHRFISASYERGLATRDMIRCRDIIQDNWFQDRWPLAFKDDQSEKTFYANTSTGWRFASSVGGRLTGYRGDRIIIDDPHDTKGAESDLVRATATRWFTETLPTRLNKASESAMVMIMQRLHVHDLSGIILDKLGDEWTHLVLPMEFEKKNRSFTTVPGKFPAQRMRRIKEDADPVPYFEPDPENGELLYLQDERTEEGELLWEERFNREAVESLKRAFRSGEGGSYAESGQLQQRPVHREGGMFKRSDFHLTTEIPPGCRWVRSWDLAGSTKKRSDWTVGLKLGMKGGVLYIWDVVRFKGESHEVEQRILETAQLDGLGVAISIPQDPGQAGKDQKRHYASLLGGFDLHFSPESGDKLVRAKPVAGQVGGGNVFVREDAPWLMAFLAEIGLFPAAVWDDQVDALSRAYAYFLANEGDPEGDAIGAPSICY